MGKLCCEVRGLRLERAWPLGVYSCLQNCAAGKRKSWGRWRAAAQAHTPGLQRKAPLRALSERQLRSSVYRGVINILRNVPPLRRCDWPSHPPWNVLISVLRCHWRAGCTGAGPARGRAPVCVSAACYSLCARGPGGGRRRVDLNVFGSPVLWPWIGSCRRRGRAILAGPVFHWSSSRVSALGGVDSPRPRGGAERAPRASLAGRIAATFRPRGHGGAGPREAAAIAFSAPAPRGQLRTLQAFPGGVSERGAPLSGLRVAVRVLSTWSPVAGAGVWDRL